MTEDGIYVGECTLLSKDYCGKAVTLSMQGCSLSTTHISMTLTPAQQRQVINWFCKNHRNIVEDALLLDGVADKQEEPFDPCGEKCENCPDNCRVDCKLDDEHLNMRVINRGKKG
jgi:hypothetical protein